jgi:hypothetical protein
VHLDDDEPEADDPLYESGEGSLICQVGVERGRIWPRCELAFVELCAQRSACLAAESDLICEWSHWDYASQSVVDAGRRVPGGQGLRRHPLSGDPARTREGGDERKHRKGTSSAVLAGNPAYVTGTL